MMHDETQNHPVERSAKPAAHLNRSADNSSALLANVGYRGQV